MSAHILIVDDVPTNIQLVASILSAYDYELSFANSGRDALQQIAQTSFDMILLDIMMPEVDGIEVAKQLKADPQNQDIPIIFLTARGDEDSMVRGFEAGAADYVIKPFSPSELQARVKTHLALKQTRDQLRQKNDELAEALETKNKLLSVASHDLKNPLSAVTGFSTILSRQKSVVQDPEAQELVGYIARAAKRMSSLILELLDTAALEMGRIQLRKSACSLQKLLDDVVSVYRISASEKQQDIQMRGQYTQLIEVDADRLHQAFDNLLSNAVKYSRLGGEINITISHVPGAVQIRFRDSGPGFSEADREKLYGYFQRLSAQPTGDEVSTGIGLAIVKQIVELHDGQIKLEKTSPEGSTFLVELPTSSPKQLAKGL